VSGARDIVWIASYPKSGNTWVRFLACNLIFGRQDSGEELNSLAPDIHELGPELIARHSGLVKTHYLCAATLPLVERTAAALYVVRRPADVLISNFHYAQRRSGTAALEGTALDRYVDSFIAYRGDPRWVELGMGSWESNVRSWLYTPHPFKVLRIRYEDLHVHPRQVAEGIVKFLNVDRSPQGIAEAVANASFERMQAIEREDIRRERLGIFFKPYLKPSIESGLRFMRRGAVGDGEQALSSDQLRRLEEAFAELTAELGYDPQQV
jgi:hypothetical protein